MGSQMRRSRVQLARIFTVLAVSFAVGLGAADASGQASDAAGAPAPAGQSQGANPCLAAQALADSGQVELAAAQYAALIQTTAEPCALAGLKALTPVVAHPDCRLGDALREAGAKEAATTAYTAVLTDDPASQCAKAGLSAIANPPQTCAAADALRDAHQDDKATEAYQAALTANPNLTCAKDGLDQLQDPGQPFFSEAAAWIPVLVVVLIALLVIFWLMSRVTPIREVMIQYPWLARRLAPRLDLTPFVPGGIDPDYSAGVSALSRERLRRGSPTLEHAAGGSIGSRAVKTSTPRWTASASWSPLRRAWRRRCDC